MGQTEKLRLADYRAPEFTTDNVDLKFTIEKDHTNVSSLVTYKRTAEGTGATELVLNAENPNPQGTDYVLGVRVNGVDLAEGHGYTYDRERHEIRIPVAAGDDEVTVEVDTYLEPKHNSKLTGLYESDNALVTQCESLGFRRITAFTDRPDVMAKYHVTIDAPKNMCPVLLSNGNMTASGDSGNGRHWASYVDPWPKPSYLFCTANGRFNSVEDNFTTMSGRQVKCRVFLEAGTGDPEKGRHALNALMLAMKWDEDVFGCEYDLDTYDVVTVSKFTFGAMENKGLNVFRDSLVMANPAIATDGNYQRIIDVIGHEYFHNWSGNRVTLANWFNISLKEGLTVLREQMFTAFTTSDAVERINTVQGALRGGQFREDDSPFAHAVLPQEVESVENAYSGTIYRKGCEIIRMMKTLMGEETFTDAVKHYFKKHDGQAVTIADFVKCMEEKSGRDFSGQFFRWYTQSGRPRVTANGQYDAATKTYTLTLEQSTPPTQDQPVKQPQVIPVVMGLVDDNGNDILPQQVLEFTKSKQSFVFKNVDREPAFHSLFRGFSAPVDIDPGLSEDQLHKQLLTDTDGFNRWDAGQKLALLEMQRLYRGYKATGQMPSASQKYLGSYHKLVSDAATDPALAAAALSMPGISELEGAVRPADPAAISAVRQHLKKTIGEELRNDFVDVFARTHDAGAYRFDYQSVGKRSLKSIAITYLLAGGEPQDIAQAKDFYFAADNMTDKMTAMMSIRDHMGAEREAVFDDFYQTFKDDTLVIQKWFASQAASNSDSIIGHLRKITASGEFNWENPGHVASVVGGFSANYSQFHRPDGEGYKFIADCILKEDGINSVTAARLVEPLCDWRKYEGGNPKLMVEQLERIAKTPGLSKDVREKVSKSLPAPEEKLQLNLAPVPGI